MQGTQTASLHFHTQISKRNSQDLCARILLGGIYRIWLQGFLKGTHRIFVQRSVAGTHTISVQGHLLKYILRTPPDPPTSSKNRRGAARRIPSDESKVRRGSIKPGLSHFPQEPLRADPVFGANGWIPLSRASVAMISWAAQAFETELPKEEWGG